MFVFVAFQQSQGPRVKHRQVIYKRSNNKHPKQWRKERKKEWTKRKKERTKERRNKQQERKEGKKKIQIMKEHFEKHEHISSKRKRLLGGPFLSCRKLLPPKARPGPHGFSLQNGLTSFARRDEKRGQQPAVHLLRWKGTWKCHQIKKYSMKGLPFIAAIFFSKKLSLPLRHFQLLPHEPSFWQVKWGGCSEMELSLRYPVKSQGQDLQVWLTYIQGF